jgi:pilus assembly protein CpaC
MIKFVKSRIINKMEWKMGRVGAYAALAIFSLTGVLATSVVLPVNMASAKGSQSTLRITARDAGTNRSVKLGLNKSLVVELPRDAHDILVANPDVADAVTRTSRRIYLFGKQIGQTNIFVFDGAGKQILSLELNIERDITGLVETIERLVPGSEIDVEMINDNLVLTGHVSTPQASSKAAQIAQIFIKGGEATQNNNSNSNTNSGGLSILFGEDRPESQIINLLQIDGEDQVHLKVTIAEISRDVVKQLGVDTNYSNSSGGFSFNQIGDNPFSLGKFASNALAKVGINGLTSSIKALEQSGVMRTLAEPTLTAISGEKASFSVGGEFPFPLGKKEDDGSVTYEFEKFKEYGIKLDFIPVVLTPGRISLKIRTEVSEPTSEDNFNIPRGAAGSASIPGLKKRVADTTVELPSGGSMVIAGLVRDDIRQTLAGTPGLSKMPIFGALFRSKEFQRHEVELVIIVTPYLVRPTARRKLARPDDNFNPASDGAGYFMGRINRVYGTTKAKLPAGRYVGNVGFIFN